VARSFAVAPFALLALACGGKTHEPEDAGRRDTSLCVADAPCRGPCGDGRIVCEPGPRCAGAIAPRGTVCRAAIGPCDYAESCDGVRVDCPEDLIAPPGEICGIWRYCDDRGACIGTTCIPGARCDSGDPCVVAYQECDDLGDFAGCVPAKLEPPGTPCSLNGTCDEAGACVERCIGEGNPCVTGVPCEQGLVECVAGMPFCRSLGPAPAGTVCRADAGECDVGETCDGVTTSCPPDAFAPEGTMCSLGACDGLGVCIY
jgi:hypothetical protein